jgi:hypothetical protein
MLVGGAVTYWSLKQAVFGSHSLGELHEPALFSHWLLVH